LKNIHPCKYLEKQKMGDDYKKKKQQSVILKIRMGGVMNYLDFAEIPMSPSNSFCSSVTSVRAPPSGPKGWFNKRQFASRVL